VASRQATPAWQRQDSRQRSKEGTIGRAQRGAMLLPPEHDQLMPQNEQLDVFSELAAPVPEIAPQPKAEDRKVGGHRRFRLAVAPGWPT
jgi:hypothetical protein